MVAKIHTLRDTDARRGSAFAFRELDARRGSAYAFRELDARRGSAYAFRDISDIRRGSAYVDPDCDKFMELPQIISVGSNNDIATKCQCWQMSSGRMKMILNMRIIVNSSSRFLVL